MAQEPTSPVSLLLSRLGMTRDDLSRHSDQMRQFLAPENSMPAPATPAQPLAAPRGAKRPHPDDDDSNPQPSSSAHRPAPPRDTNMQDALPLPLTPASARHYRANVYDQLAGTSRTYGAAGPGPSPATSTSASASSARRPLVFASSSSPYYRPSPARSTPGSSPAPPPPSSSPYIPTTSRGQGQAQVPVQPQPAQLPFVLPPGPYSPHKPDAPYAALIGRAILASPSHRLTLQEIYDYITTVYPYFTRHEQTWQNSIRHVLSTTVVFRKVQRERAAGRTLWAIWDQDVDAFEGGGFRKERVKEMREAMAKKGGGARGKKDNAVKTEVKNEAKTAQPSFRAPAVKVTPNSSGRRAKRARKDEPTPPMASLEEDAASSRAPSVAGFPPSSSYAQSYYGSSRAPSVATTDYDLPPPSSVYASSEYSRVPPSSASFAETRSSRYPSEAVSEHDQYLADSRAAYEARFRDDDDEEQNADGEAPMEEEVQMGVPLDQVQATVKVEEPEADDAFAAQRRAYEARFQDDEAEAEPEPTAVEVEVEVDPLPAVDTAAASRAAYEARFADDEDEDEQPAAHEEPPQLEQSRVSPSPAPSRIEIDYAGRPGHLSDDPDDYLSYPEDDNDESPKQGEVDSSPPSLTQPGSSVSASSLGISTPPSAAGSSSAISVSIGESALRYDLRRDTGKARDKDSLPSPPRPSDRHARKRARYDAYLASPAGPRAADSFDVDMDTEDELDEEEEEERIQTRRGRGRVKARAKTKAKTKQTTQQTRPTPAPPAPRAPESPTLRRGTARPLTRRFSTPPRARTTSPSPPPNATATGLPTKSKSFAAPSTTLATPATPQQSAPAPGLPHPPAFSTRAHATPGRVPLYPRPSSAFAHTPGSLSRTFGQGSTTSGSGDEADKDMVPPVRFSTPPPLSRTQHAVSAERTPLSYEGVHMSPSPSLAYFKTHLFPPPSFPTATPSAGPSTSTAPGFVAPQGTPSRAKNVDKDSKGPAAGVFATPLTPRRLAFPGSAPQQSPFRTPGLFNALFDPHDPGAALDEELKRMDARAGALEGEGTPGGMGFARGMLYASPIGGYGYGERESPAAGRWGRYG